MAFKMKGHTLPGIKQKASAKATDGRAKSSAFQAADVSDFKDMGKTMQEASPKEESSNLEIAGQMLGGTSPAKHTKEVAGFEHQHPHTEKQEEVAKKWKKKKSKYYVPRAPQEEEVYKRTSKAVSKLERYDRGEKPWDVEDID